MPRRTNPFQQLTASILATVHAPDYIVEESVLEVNKKTGLPREIDIKITEKANSNNKILVECRDHKRKQDVIWIDILDGKARSLGFKKVIAVSSSGFYKTAVKEAASRGIETLHLKEAEEIEWKKWLFALNEFGLEIDYEPVVKKVNFVFPNGFQHPSFGDLEADQILMVNPLLKGKILLKDALSQIIKDPKTINYIRPNNAPNSIGQYDYTYVFDKGWGIINKDGKFVPLLKLIVSLESKRLSEKVKLSHILVDGKRILTGSPKITGPNSRLVLEEKPGQLLMMTEQRTIVQNPKRATHKQQSKNIKDHIKK